jgi:hypothetical protein
VGVRRPMPHASAPPLAAQHGLPMSKITHDGCDVAFIYKGECSAKYSLEKSNMNILELI